MYTVEHIGIAVKSLKESNPLFAKLLNASPYKEEVVADQGVVTSFFQAGQAKVELLEATHADSPIHRFIERKGEGIHHIAFEVPDIRVEMKRLKEAGFQLLSDEPTPGAENKWVCFVHPKSANGVLVEICQTIPAVGVAEQDGLDL
jgi:methylmalonyl-CoA/ethylmalonyl-CoA epimerase